jgi:hypothetical protein
MTCRYRLQILHGTPARDGKQMPFKRDQSSSIYGCADRKAAACSRQCTRTTANAGPIWLDTLCSYGHKHMALGTRGPLRFIETVQSTKIDKHKTKDTTMYANSNNFAGQHERQVLPLDSNLCLFDRLLWRHQLDILPWEGEELPHMMKSATWST